MRYRNLCWNLEKGTADELRSLQRIGTWSQISSLGKSLSCHKLALVRMIMQYKLLGATEIGVSELCLGAMTFSEDWNWSANEDTSQAIFEAFAEAGGNFIVPANSYTNGTSEKMLGEFVGSERNQFVLATKYTMMTKGYCFI